MSESPQTPQSSRKKKLLIAAIGAVAVCVLTAGTIVGVNVSNGKTEQLCTEAATSSEDAAKAVRTSVEKAAEVQTQADGAEGYAHGEGAAALVQNVDSTKSGFTEIDLGGDCESREDAEAIRDNSETAKSQVAKLDAATKKLTTEVTAFQMEAKRVADEKAAADKAAAKIAEEAEKAKASEAVAAEQATADQSAAAPAPVPASQPQYASGGTAYAPAPQAPKSNAPAPYVPAPVPAPAPVTGGGSGTGGWTPPPMGSGGGNGCINLGSGAFCNAG